MEDKFISYLLGRKYAESTTLDYAERVAIVRKSEGLSWEEFINNIDKIVLDYDMGGKKSELGNKSHRTVINALKRFQEFILENNVNI